MTIRTIKTSTTKIDFKTKINTEKKSYPNTNFFSREVYNGTLLNVGDSTVHPAEGYYYSPAGVHQGMLQIAPLCDFQLRLFKWNGYYWQEVANTLYQNSSEILVYTGDEGYYTWLVESFWGTGSYHFWLIRPERRTEQNLMAQ